MKFESGLIAEITSGEKYLVVKFDSDVDYDGKKNDFILLNVNFGFLISSDYNSDLECPTDKYFDIMKLYRKIDVSSLNFFEGGLEMIWERKKNT